VFDVVRATVPKIDLDDVFLVSLLATEEGSLRHFQVLEGWMPLPSLPADIVGG
jgi:hypothetical protein